MKSNITTTTVNGREYRTWSDIIARATFAEDIETGEVKAIKHNGYINNNLTIRKAIACYFGLATFRK